MDVLFSLLGNHKKKLIALAILSAVAIGSVYVLGADNPVEQGAEKLISEETGIDVDFSPEK